MKNIENVVSALKSAEWPDVSIGNKALIGAAIAALEAADNTIKSFKPVYQYRDQFYNDENGETEYYWEDCDETFYNTRLKCSRRILYSSGE